MDGLSDVGAVSDSEEGLQAEVDAFRRRHGFDIEDIKDGYPPPPWICPVMQGMCSEPECGDGCALIGPASRMSASGDPRSPDRQTLRPVVPPSV